MRRPAEHIHGLASVGAVAVLAEEFRIAGEGGGVTGDVDDAGGETQVRVLGWEDPLEKEMATYSSIPAWRIPWTEEPGERHPT